MKSIWVEFLGKALLLVLGVHVASAQNLGTEIFTADRQDASNNANEHSPTYQVWRCSLDGKFYAVTNWNGVHVRAINSGLITAEVWPLADKKGNNKTDKKGNKKLEGRWGSTTYGGLIVIQDTGPDKVRGFLLEPTRGIPAAECNSRKSAVLLSIGQPAPICNVLTVTWDVQPGVSADQAAAEETTQNAQLSNISLAQSSSFNDNSDGRLVGTWFKQVFDGYARYTTTLVLRSDGTYTKALMGTNHSGTWTSSGNFVHLSGDRRYPPTDENLSLFQKTVEEIRF